jgi:transposase
VPRVAATRRHAKKKALKASEGDTPRIALLRREYWGLGVAELAERLVFIDETGINLLMTRSYARARRGERAVGFVPRNWGDSLTLVAGLTTAGIIAPLVMRGSMNALTFACYVEQFLIPELHVGDIVVLDNLKAHHDGRIEPMLKAAGIGLRYLPPYAPELSPIEPAWSKVKRVLRTIGARSWKAITRAAAKALQAVTKSDAVAWFSHCGYTVPCD